MSLFKGLDTPFFDSSTGEPLAFGFVYFGQPNQNAIANPKVPYANQALSTPLAATQELTIAGKFEQEVWLDGDYSVIITDSFGVQQAEYLVVPQSEGGGAGGGLPAGGTTGQVLAKSSDTDYDTEWVNQGGGTTSTTVTALSISSGNVEVDVSIGALFTLNMTEDVTGWTYVNTPGAGNGGSIMVLVTQGDPARTLALNEGSEWTDGSYTDLEAGVGVRYLLAMTSFDNFATVGATMGKLLGVEPPEPPGMLFLELNDIDELVAGQLLELDGEPGSLELEE